MKVLFAIPGHLKTVPMGRFCADALRALGHELEVFDYRPRPMDKLLAALGTSAEEKSSINRRLRARIDAFHPELFFALYGFDVSRETLEYLRGRGIPTACWWINDPFQFERALKKGPLYDFLFSNASGDLDRYLAAGVRHAHFLPTACDPAVHRPLPPVDQFRCDVVFAGDWSALRERVVTDLAGQFDVKVFGPWKKKMQPNSPLLPRLRQGFFTPDEMAQMFASAKVVLNLHTWYGKFDHGLNPRLFEAAACGAYQLVDFKREIPDLFDCRKEVVCYQTLDDIAPAIEAALKMNDADRKAIGDAARKRALGEHTYVHRMQKMLEIIARES